jgi:hypothetical protein
MASLAQSRSATLPRFDANKDVEMTANNSTSPSSTFLGDARDEAGRRYCLYFTYRRPPGRRDNEPDGGGKATGGRTVIAGPFARGVQAAPEVWTAPASDAADADAKLTVEVARRGWART